MNIVFKDAKQNDDDHQTPNIDLDILLSSFFNHKTLLLKPVGGKNFVSEFIFEQQYFGLALIIKK